jgi:hypothetical protein
VAQGVASHVAVTGGVRQFADADAIEDDPDHTVKMWVGCRHGGILPERPDFLRVTAMPVVSYSVTVSGLRDVEAISSPILTS